MAVSRLLRIAASAPVPVFLASGDAGRSVVPALLADERVELVVSPRHASVLLVAGAIPRRDEAALAHVHDQLPEPRAVVWSAWTWPPDAFVDPVIVGPGDPLGDVLVATHRAVLVGDGDPSPRLLTADHPVAWQGTGDHGQGGEGMMGGTPYGREMAMTGPDPRDRLQLDRVPLSVGPFLAPWWPPGLRLDLVLQGDVIAHAEVSASRPFDDVADGAAPGVGADSRGGPDVVLDVLLALGDRRNARRWVGPGGLSTTQLRRALRGVPPGTGASELDGRDVRARVEHARSGGLAQDHVPHLPHVLPGLSWREAMVTVASMGIDLTRVGSTATGGAE